jgi:hypothetical protein
MSAVKKKINPAISACHFRADCHISLQFGNSPGFYPFPDKPWRITGMYTDPDAIDLYQFPGERVFPFCGFASGEQSRASGNGTPHHASGVGCVGCDHCSVREFNVGKKTFVAADKFSG